MKLSNTTPSAHMKVGIVGEASGKRKSKKKGSEPQIKLAHLKGQLKLLALELQHEINYRSQNEES
jgi:hypothetical protein